jgi:hypothetical protein
MGRTHRQRRQRADFVGAAPVWAEWSDEQLLDLRMCDLALRLEGTFYQEPIAQLSRELDARRLLFHPHFWISDEWFTPDGVPGIAVPFYLAHPRLAKLEASQMLEVEGGTRDWCMRILRHEAGHAIENAYLLRRRRRRQKLFGRSSQPYPEYYTPRPYSRSFVRHLDVWYAQSHPDEDFRGNLCRVAGSALALEGTVSRLAGDEEAGFHGATHGRVGGYDTGRHRTAIAGSAPAHL